MTYGSSLSLVESEILSAELTPRHGSGATADRLRGNRKWDSRVWHSRLEHLFPYGEYCIPNWRYHEELSSVKYLEPEEEPPSKLVAIPKTATKPRLIAEEPTCMQFVQQAMLLSLVGHLEQGHTSRWFVGFSDQTPNQRLARIGSEDGSLATLDLSDASDSVANWLVEDLFSNFPTFLEGIQASRSTRCKLPSGEILSLQKFASMGSALTFPIEAMVFSAVAIAGVLAHRGTTPTLKAIKSLRGSVRVYGDDIIVPTDCAETVIDWLETFGFKVNRHKSFWTGEFRESCGKDYWRGHDVSVVKFRKRIPSDRQQADEIISTVKTRNLLYQAGMSRTADLLDDVLVKVLQHFPWVTDDSPILGRVHKSGLYQVDEMCPNTHAPLVKGYVQRSKPPKSELDGTYALVKCLLTTIGNADVMKKHLKRAGRPRDVSINLVKARPF